MAPPKGYSHTEEAKKKIGKAAEGNKYLLGRKENQANAWKGSSAGYRAIHTKVERELGKPRRCDNCLNNKKKGPKQYQWANISGKYKRDVTDYIRLCAKCHRAFDMGRLKLRSH